MWQININGPGYFDTTYDLSDGTTFIGRADSNDIVLSGDKVSRRHAMLQVDADRVSVVDLESRNGTRINGKRIDGTHVLKPGDVLVIGNNSLYVQRPAEDAAKTDPVDLQQMTASGLTGVKISGEIVIAQGSEKNPYLEHFGKLGAYDPRRGHEKNGQTTDKSFEEYESFFLLIKVSEKLNTSTSLKQFVEDVIGLIVDVTQARTGIVLLCDERKKLSPMVVRHSEELAQGEVPVSDAILAEVAQKKVALALMDAKMDKRFATRESVLLYDLEQVICVPMLKGDELLGVIYLNRHSGGSIPVPRLIDVVSAIAHMAANGVESWRLREKALANEQARKVLERFHSPAIVDRIIQEMGQGQGKGLGAMMEPKEVTVMFADISGFTPLIEKLPPEQIANLLNEFYSRMTQVIFSFEGTVDKFIGDAVMAVFGAPFARSDDASRAVRCALACRRDFQEMMRRRPMSEMCGIKIGLNTGKVLAGTLGCQERIEYTCLGDAVNIAERLQSTANPGQVLITGKTLASIGARFDVEPLGECQLKGKKRKVAVFEVVEEASDLYTDPGI
jgi:adenylate cyclase